VDKSDSDLCPTVCFGISSAELLGSGTIALVKSLKCRKIRSAMLFLA
jgi:hypothetical protein